MTKHSIDDILEQGIALFRRKGYHNTGISEITGSCNMPKESFYYFFESKEDFAIRSISQYGKMALATFKDQLSNETLSY